MHFLTLLMRLFFVWMIVGLISCRGSKTILVPERKSVLGGTAFYQKAFGMQWAQRDSFVLQEVFAGNIPEFLKKFHPVKVVVFDSITKKIIRATYFVSPDYLSVGTNKDWVRVNITPLAAQKIADSLQCFLPTPKMVDDIYKAANVKLIPVPMYALRDSTPTMWQHHLIIEGQRKGRKGLIAGIKKDVVITDKLLQHPRQDRVAIYGWHQLNGQPIQPVYTGHIYWYVDYSQGIRLVYRKIKVNGKWMDYTEVLKDNSLQKLLCSNAICNYFRYP